MDLKRTPLHSLYAEYGGKTVEFGGWDMPVQFTSIVQEHECVRTRVGLFDVSHMGEFECTGTDAQLYLQTMVTNDVSKLKPGKALYSPLVYDHGGTVDDLLIYCFDASKFWIVVNAGNIQKDWEWLTSHIGDFQVNLVNRSDEIALLALQGPMAEQALQPYCDAVLSDIPFYGFVEGEVVGASAVISRTGYTGEDGFELYVQRHMATRVWRMLLQGNEGLGIQPCGLGARDTLRLEARLPLYGHELSETISPLEAGLSSFVSLSKGNFIGREALLSQKEVGNGKRVVGLLMQERGIPRAGQRVFHEGVDIGVVTSGTMSPTLKAAIALALVDGTVAVPGTSVDVDIRGKRVRAEVIKTPFYRRTKKG